MATVNLKVGGMSCEMCVGHVTRALLSVDGVVSAKVELEGGSAVVVTEDEQSRVAELIDAVTEEGYEAEEAS